MTDETAAKRAAVLGQLLGSREQHIAELEAENERLRAVVDAARTVNERQRSCRCEAFFDLAKALRELDSES